MLQSAMGKLCSVMLKVQGFRQGTYLMRCIQQLFGRGKVAVQTWHT